MSLIYEMMLRERRRPFVERGDRLEAIIRGFQEGRAKAKPGDNPADVFAATIIGEWVFVPTPPNPRDEFRRVLLAEYAKAQIRSHVRSEALRFVTDPSGS